MHDIDEHYERLKAVCCQQWHIPPWEFDRASEAELIDYADVQTLLGLLSVTNREAVAWVFEDEIAEEEQKQQAERREANRRQTILAMLALAKPETPEQQAKIDRIRRRFSGG